MKNRFLYASVLASSLLVADSFYNTSSLQGTTGVINTPTAEVLEKDKIEFSYSNQVDLTKFKGDKEHYTADQYIVNFGFLPNLELTGRLANIEDKNKPWTRWHGQWVVRDLSASFKYQIPLYYPYLPKIAVGIQDLGGQADNYDAKYIVATHSYGILRGSVGYGFDSINLLDGAFGSLELKATDWATLLAEYDSKDKQVGLRINTPSYLSNYFDLAFLAKANLSDSSQRFSFGVNLRVSLGDNHDNLDPTTPISTTTTYNTTPSTTSGFDLVSLAQNLIDFGFENVDTGELGGAIYVAYENNVLDHNELDAIGVILGYMAKMNAPYDNFVLVTKHSDTKVKQLTGSLSAFKQMIQSPDPQTLASFRESLHLIAVDDSQVSLTVDSANPSYLKTRVQLSPGLITFVGTNFGVLDYLVSARVYAHTTLYKGFDLGVVGDYPLFHSDELDRKTGAFRRSNQGSRLISALLNRSDAYGDFVNVASAGIYGDFWAVMDSLTYTHENHTFSLKLDYLEERDPPEWRDEKTIRTNYLGIYSYYVPQLDTNFRLSAGEYYYGDHGFEVRMKKFFGDTAISFFYQNSDQNYIGINVALPLTPRRVGDYMVQLKGKNDFNYGLRTTVQDDDGRNTLETDYLVRIYNEFDTERTFLNRNRFSTDYIKKHILRLRDAYITYVSGE